MTVAQHLMQLVVTAWLGSQMIGVLSIGPMPAHASPCPARGEQIISMLYKRQQHTAKGRRIKFVFRCVESHTLII